MLGVFYGRIAKKEMLNALLSSAYTIGVDILSLNLGDLLEKRLSSSVFVSKEYFYL